MRVEADERLREVFRRVAESAGGKVTFHRSTLALVEAKDGRLSLVRLVRRRLRLGRKDRDALAMFVRAGLGAYIWSPRAGFLSLSAAAIRRAGIVASDQEIAPEPAEGETPLETVPRGTPVGSRRPVTEPAEVMPPKRDPAVARADWAANMETYLSYPLAVRRNKEFGCRHEPCEVCGVSQKVYDQSCACRCHQVAFTTGKMNYGTGYGVPFTHGEGRSSMAPADLERAAPATAAEVEATAEWLRKETAS